MVLLSKFVSPLIIFWSFYSSGFPLIPFEFYYLKLGESRALTQNDLY